MKKLALLLFVLLAAAPAVAADGMLMLGPDGATRIVEGPSTWIETGVTVSGDAAKFPNAVSEAYRNSGVPVAMAVDAGALGSQRGWFSVRKTTRVSRGVVYDVQRKRIDVVPMNIVTVGEKSFNPFLILLGLAVMCMVMSSMSQIKVEPDALSSFCATIFASLAIFAAMFSFVLAVVVVAGLVAIAAFGAFIAPTRAEYRISIGAFYLLALAASLLWFFA